MGFRWIFIIAVSLMILPVLAESETEQSGLSVDAPGVATVNQTIEVLVTSSKMPVSDAIVFFTIRNAQFQQTTDENGIAAFTPEDTGRLYVLAHKDGLQGAETMIEVRDAPEQVIDEPATPQPIPTDAESPGFGCAALMILVYIARKIRDR
ncbi:MAG: hypothetical protein U9N07_03200 [Euryarchaeota archaeon]|nr:hypothetical protein [Euryarchaeota archaeon]